MQYLKVENGHYQIDWEDVEKKLKIGVKLLIMSNSHNPVGRVWTKEELTRIGTLCLQYGVTILSDESIPILPSSDTSTW